MLNDYTHMSQEETVFLIVRGKVQEVLFRKTLVLAGHNHGVQVGGTNSKDDKNRVDVTVRGPADKIEELIHALGPNKKLNSVGAEIESIERVAEGIAVEDHITHTRQFETLRFPTGVEFFV